MDYSTATMARPLVIQRGKGSQRVLFVAGPFRAADTWGVVENLHGAAEVALALWRMGAAVICPHLNTAPFQGAAPDRMWLDGDLTILERCDGLVLAPGWEKSDGARDERAHAYVLEIPVFVWPADREAIQTFIDGGKP